MWIASILFVTRDTTQSFPPSAPHTPCINSVTLVLETARAHTHTHTHTHTHGIRKSNQPNQPRA